MSNLNAKFQASLTQIEWELWIRSSTVKWEFPSRLVIGTHGTRTVTWKKNHGWNSRVPWKLTVKRHLRIHSNTEFCDCILPRSQRLSKLKDTYKFRCSCSRCCDMDFSSSDASATLMTNFLKSDTCGNYDPLALRRFISSASERDGIRNSISVDGIITQIVADEVGIYVVQYV
jgi:hypothetical protein